jgi:uncharacterized iron-regulated membrane protein
MRTHIWIISGTLLFLAVSGAASQQSQPAQSQSASDQKTQAPATPAQQPAPTLAEAARKAREQKKTEVKSTHVFTNDNLPVAGGVSVVGESSASAAAGQASSAAAGSDEKMWRDRFTGARAKLQRDQADLDVMQRELSKLQVQFYPNDPTKQLLQSVTNTDINDKRAKIAQRQKDVQNDQAAISDLEDQLRKSGGDPGWAR